MNHFKAVELFIERSFNKAMKSFSSRGALNTKVRIADNVIFVKMKVEYTELEKKMFSYILSKQEESGYYRSIRGEAKDHARKVLGELAPLNITDMSHRFYIDRDLVFTLIVLDKDLEKLIREGKITAPIQCKVIART